MEGERSSSTVEAPRARREGAERGDAVVWTMWPTGAACETACWPTAPPAPQIRTLSFKKDRLGVGEGADMPRKTCSAATTVLRGKDVRAAWEKGVSLI